MSTAVSPEEHTDIADAMATQDKVQHWLFVILALTALVYALLAGLRTVTDYDLFWQMATGRWIVQHHSVPSIDVFSYTAAGQPWIYPVGSGLLFYGIFQLGGYPLLSWLGAIACVLTVALLLRRGNALIAGIAIFAVAPIAARTSPRADMFTVVLFAAFLSVLWEQYETGRARLWLLPVLMAAWANLHLGFVAGLGLMAAYVGMEVLRLFGQDRGKSVGHLRRAWPWLLATAASTLLNPWGWNLYTALYRQESAMRLHSEWITEWGATRLNLQSLRDLIVVRSWESSFYVLLLVAVIAIGFALVQRQFGAALLLIAASYVGIRHARMHALFACVVVIVGGAVLSRALTVGESWVPDARMRQILASGAAALLVLLTVLRSADLVTNRRYFGSTDTGNFGAGLSWWYPEAATKFILSQSLPPEIFNTYNAGGFVVWALGPAYRDFIDGRAIPFGPDIFERQQRFLNSSPSSPTWQADGPGGRINVILAPLARYDGIQFFPYLSEFCSSQDWGTVYLDEVSAVFVRRTPATEPMIQRLQVNCATAPLPRPSDDTSKASVFNKWANATSVLSALQRNQEALAAANNALAIYPESAVVRFMRGNLLAGMGYVPQAEQDYLISVNSEPTDVTWMELARLYRSQGHFPQAIDALEHAVEVSKTPYNALLELGSLYLEAHRPADALRVLDEAERNAPPAAEIRNLYLANVAEGHAAAWNALGNSARAIASQEEATRLAPNDAEIWKHLAGLYAAQNRTEDAQRAQQRADSLSGTLPH